MVVAIRRARTLASGCPRKALGREIKGCDGNIAHPPSAQPSRDGHEDYLLYAGRSREDEESIDGRPDRHRSRRRSTTEYVHPARPVPGPGRGPTAGRRRLGRRPRPPRSPNPAGPVRGNLLVDNHSGATTLTSQGSSPELSTGSKRSPRTFEEISSSVSGASSVSSGVLRAAGALHRRCPRIRPPRQRAVDPALGRITRRRCRVRRPW